MPDIPHHCPNCRTSILTEQMLSDKTTHIDVCPTCRGGWFDSRELAAVLSVAMSKLTPLADTKKTSHICPKCRIPLCRLPYPETRIEVDVCEQCLGIWLDRGEFRGLNHARARYQDNSKFEPTPKSFKEAAFRFVDRVLERFGSD